VKVPRPYRPGFSLVELLVAMAITSVIMLALFSLVGQSTDGYTRTQRAVNSISQARAFIQFFGRELSTRLPGTPMIHEKASGSGVVEASEKIAFVRAVSSDEQQAAKPGDLNLVSYRVAFTQDTTNTVSPKLFRAARDPALTQTFLETPGSPAFPADDPALDEPIVANVIGFTAKPRHYSGTPPVLTDWTTTSPQNPSVIELTIRFIDDSTAQRFKTRAEWERIATAPRENEKPFIRTFTRTIAIAK
jgi:prepilin-type N-terminal cleavage/methylation domain-containing protein